ncbi:MAG: hypothetical protein ABFE01_06515 [Phycisphaerales bacterium]
MKRRKEQLDIKRLMLMGSIVCVLLGTMGSLSLAALRMPGDQAATGVLGQSVSVFDPFTLQTTLVSDDTVAAQDGTSPRVEALSSRVPIRIPYRPPVRSAFRTGPGF